MNEYEVLIETINPCGGEAHANKEFKGTLVRYTFTE